MTEEIKKKKPSTLTLGLHKATEGSVKNTSGASRSNGIRVEVRKKRFVTRPSVRKVDLIDGEKANRLKVLKAALKADEEAKELQKKEAETLKKQQEALAKEAEAQKENLVQEEIENFKEVSLKEDVKEDVKEEIPSKKEAPPKEKKFENEEEKTSSWKTVKHKTHPESTEELATPRRKKDSEYRRQNSRIDVFNLDEDGEEIGRRRRSLASIKRAREKERLKHAESLKTAEKISREVTIPETITVQELANRMAERGVDVVKVLMKLGMMVTITQTIDADTAELVVSEFGHKTHRVADADIEDGLKGQDDDPSSLIPRSPVVTVMGHVDHGKTSLLDALRSTHVVEGEAGGITQHIGAYQVQMKTGQKVTFIDTPGHAAFTEMRARGASVTDVVILVVAANDGVMPQTIEAIHHAQAAGVPIVVAINKMDLPGADPNRVRTDLLQHNVIVEQMGGDVLSVEVSAKKRTNLEKLIEAVLLQAEVLDLKANPNRLAQGVVIEARMEKGRGPVATVLVQRGTLKMGDVFVAGAEFGRVRSAFDDKGQKVESAGPAVPVEVIGLQGVPSAGDDFIVVEEENKAREIANYRTRKAREILQVKSKSGTLMEQMAAQIKAGKMKEVPVVIKADVQGSVEALVGTLNKIANDEVRVHVLHAAVGGINESDVTLARASKATVIGFNVRANPQARELARRDGVDLRYYSIIYDVVDEMKKAVEGLLTPELKEKILGYAEVRQVFNITKVGKIAGCMVTEKLIKRSAKARLLRDNVVIFDGNLSELKRFKDDVREVKEGFDCGISFEKYDDIKVGDQIECYEVEEIKAELKLG
ncbi:MAG: translation initiation factor IF-2 [Alphaproteobacteria bacterium]|nr:translation initiation factor IF-2 [Alphaproteobacteria bacterium]